MPKRKVAHRKRKQTGAGVGSAAKKLFSIVKENKLLSRGLGFIPHPAAQVASTIAGQLGMGKRRKTARRKKSSGAGSISVVTPVVHHVRRRIPNVVKTNQRGAGFFSDLGGGIGNVFSGLGNGIGGIFR